MSLSPFRLFLLGGVVCGVLAAPVIGCAQGAQTAPSTASDASAPTTAEGQEAALKSEEKANKQREKAARAQRKALRAQDKANKAEKKAGEQPGTTTPH